MPLRTHWRVGKAAGSRIESGTAMGEAHAPGSITKHSPIPIVILGLDPGIRCVGPPVKGLVSDEARRTPISAARADAVQIPGSSPRMTRDEMPESAPPPTSPNSGRRWTWSLTAGTIPEPSSASDRAGAQSPSITSRWAVRPAAFRFPSPRFPGVRRGPCTSPHAPEHGQGCWVPDRAGTAMGVGSRSRLHHQTLTRSAARN